MPEVPKDFSEVMIDSGGFQMQKGTGDREVILSGYSMWLQLLLPQHPEVTSYMNLDVWRDGEQSLKNLQYLESEGLHPVPIWHSGTDVKFLKNYYDNYEYIAIGGIAGLRDKTAMCQLVDWLFQSYPDRKYHFLGVGLSGIRAFGAYKPYSVDFSTWSVPARYGHEIALDDDDLVKEVVLSDELKQKMREDKGYEREMIRTAVQRIKQLETQVDETYRPAQGLLF